MRSALLRALSIPQGGLVLEGAKGLPPILLEEGVIQELRSQGYISDYSAPFLPHAQSNASHHHHSGGGGGGGSDDDDEGSGGGGGVGGGGGGGGSSSQAVPGNEYPSWDYALLGTYKREADTMLGVQFVALFVLCSLCLLYQARRHTTAGEGIRAAAAQSLVFVHRTYVRAAGAWVAACARRASGLLGCCGGNGDSGSNGVGSGTSTLLTASGSGNGNGNGNGNGSRVRRESMDSSDDQQQRLSRMRMNRSRGGYRYVSIDVRVRVHMPRECVPVCPHEQPTHQQRAVAGAWKWAVWVVSTQVERWMSGLVSEYAE